MDSTLAVAIKESHVSIDTLIRLTKNDSLTSKQIASDLRGNLLRLGLHRLMQKLVDSKHKFPARLRGDKLKAVQAYGEYLYRIFMLCERLHPSQSESYKTALDWFMRICLEIHGEQKQVAIASKSEIAQSRLNQLRRGQNPICEACYPHTWRLIEASLTLLGGHPYWNSYLKALTAWKEEEKFNKALKP